ncbi:hypothetical protein A5821_000122 [Enterococcus sp. 7F3_DIV0205]|uniref:Uncharacterized protein n=2 Tax=Candidatus Enterococcus palustris TaxID=1834189 RepID=A0AAQ3W6K1_9ENTE|nr:hypothetical protein A5821_000456 [Enterococcus sp. 7F3_DIV0205]
MKGKMDNWLKNKNTKLVLTGIAIVLVAFGATYAWWTARIEMKQDVTMGKLRIAASFEELSDPKGFEPGTFSEINGEIRNEGDIPAMVKIDNSSQIKFAYADDQFTVIPVEDRQFISDTPNAIKLSLAPTSGDYTDNEDVYWFKDTLGQLYVLMEAGASLAVNTRADYDGEIMGNKYQEAEIKIGALLRATQVIDGALSQEFGLSFKELTDVQANTQNGRSKRTISNGQVRLQELMARGK